MSDVFAFVHNAEPLKAIQAHFKPITFLIQQVTDCGYYITEYTIQKSFVSCCRRHNTPYVGIRTAKYTISDINARITDYVNKLQQLKTAFVEGVVLRRGVTVVRMVNVVEHTGRSDALRLQSDIHGPGIQRSRSI